MGRHKTSPFIGVQLCRLPMVVLVIVLASQLLPVTARRRSSNEELQISVYPAQLSVREGREATFECRARAADNSVYPEVRWTREGGPLPPKARESGGRLTFPQAQLAHSGRYVCLAMHRGKSVEATGHLHVQSYGPQELQGDTGGGAAAGGCTADERACGSNECVKLEYVCDGEPDCRDRSDELNCPAKRHCEPNEFRCRNDKCVQKMWLCDGDDDCGDGSDELNCGQRRPGDMCQPTEFRCTDQRQCVPQSFQCDGTNDCQDGSDEIGCVQPTVVTPPKSNLEIPQGSDFNLTCRAVGVPDPYINWRLNWADVCEPPRCQQASEGGVGTLTVQNAQPLDQGAYTCEAINVKGRVLATPDCIVRIVSIPAPQPAPPPVQPARLSCSPQGAYSPYSDTRGLCQCKPLTTGPTCGQCSPGAFNLNEKAPQGCLKCFCFGVTDRCHSSSLFRTKEKVFFGGDSMGVELSDSDGRTQPGLQFEFEPYGFLSHNEPHFHQTFYWKMPQRFLGDKVTAYGGDLSIQLQYQGSGPIRNEPLIVLRGNGITLQHTPRDQESMFTPGQPFTVRVPTYEQHYEHRDGRGQASREDLMMALADLEILLIRATHTEDQTGSSLGENSWEIAVPRDTQDVRALEVEQCECPPGYTGTSCEDCAEGYERSPGPYLGVCVPARRAQPTCSAVGALSTQPQWDGRCQCKQNVVGATCDRCAPESFHLSPQQPGGCLRCWCSGVTAVCESSHWRRSQVQLDYARGDRDQLEAISADARSPFRAPTQPQAYGGALHFNGFSAAGRTTLYWALPQKFLGDKVTAYGGKLRYKFRFTGAGNRNQDADVVLRGNDMQLEYHHRQPVQSDLENSIEVPFSEAGWVRSQDRQPVSREQLLTALADVDALLVKMSYMSDCSSASLVSVSLDSADAYGQGEAALDVEQCQCPPGYTGTSCEDCAPGYSRTQGGPYMGLCEKCECHGHASQCDSEYGACIDCQHNTEGDRCERCKPGFAGDARRGTPHDCQSAPEPARPPCQCHNHSPRGCDSYGRCLQCEHNTEGWSCEVCKKGYYGDARKGTPYDCQPCPCPGDRECFLDERGQVQCRNCPPGYGGSLCDECAPGYTRSQALGGRECEPVGRHLPSEVEFVPAPEGSRTRTTVSSTTDDPKLELGGLVDIEVPREEDERPPWWTGQDMAVVAPDRMLQEDRGREAGEQPTAERGEDQSQREGQAQGTEGHGGEQQQEQQQQKAGGHVRHFEGTTALNMPSERGQQLDQLDLEVQVRPSSPNGVILHATSPSAPSAAGKNKKSPFVHTLELANGKVHYSFVLGGESQEVLRSKVSLPLEQWSTLRVANDGRSRASLRVNSAPPSELFYSPPPLQSQPAKGPARIYLGGLDPAQASRRPQAVNFIGTIGRVRLNRKELDLREEGRPTEETEPTGEEGEKADRLDEEANPCSREPCQNGGQCRLERWGAFKCHCPPGFGGSLCQLPSSDGICPGGRRWCHRGICSPLGGVRSPLCLCPAGWKGSRCEKEVQQNEPVEASAIHFDGKHSFLAIPLAQENEEEGEREEQPGQEAAGKGFVVEFRLVPEQTERTTVRDQLVVLVTGSAAADGDQSVTTVLGTEGERLWAIQQQQKGEERGKQPSTKRFLTKRVKSASKKGQGLLRLEQTGPGEMRLLVDGRARGNLRVAAGPAATFWLGGLPPRGPIFPRELDSSLAGLRPFAGCVEELKVNGKPIGREQLAKLTGANLGSCRAKEEGGRQQTGPERGGEEAQSAKATAAPPAMTTALPVVSVSEDPMLAEQRRGGADGQPLMEAEEEEENEAMEGWPATPSAVMEEEPLAQTSTAVTESLVHPSSTVVTPFRKIDSPEEEGETASSSEEQFLPQPSTEAPWPSTTTTASRVPEPTTLVPAPPRHHWRQSSSPAPRPPVLLTNPDSSVELQELPFPGLCDAKTCGEHGNCEEVNASHVACACRDYWVGQVCEEFRPIEYAAKFDGTAFVVFSSDEFPHLVSDREESIQFKLRTRAPYGVVVWQGQQPDPGEEVNGDDYLSIGLLDGHLAFSFELGGGAAHLVSEQPVNDGRVHTVRAIRQGRNGTLLVDDQRPVRGRSSGILAMLNVEGHLFVGGVPELHQMTSGMHTHNFMGCLAELGLNGQRMDLMGNAIDGRNVRPCKGWRPDGSRRARRRRQWLRRQRKAAGGGEQRQRDWPTGRNKANED